MCWIEERYIGIFLLYLIARIPRKQKIGFCLLSCFMYTINNYLLFYYVGAHTIGVLQNKLVRAFPIEAGHFNQSEKVIPDCPGECTATIRTEMNAFLVHMSLKLMFLKSCWLAVIRTPFGIKRVIKNERTFEKLLNFYVKVKNNVISLIPRALFHIDRWKKRRRHITTLTNTPPSYNP